MEPVTVLKTSTEAVSLVAALAKLVKENRKKTGTPLYELLGRLQLDAVRIGADLETRLRLLSEKLGDLGLDPKMSLDAQIKDLSWYNWVRRAQLKAYREEFHAAYRQLTSFIDDATALLLCEGSHAQTPGITTEMFAEANRKKAMLDGVLMDPGRTLESILQALLSAARDVTEELRAA